MAHLLSTINPAVAAQLQNGTPPEGTPAVGDVVVFRGRAGERRAGKLEWPALVMGLHTDGALDLLVILDANDMSMRDRVRRATDAEATNAWVLRDSVREVEPFEPSRLNGMTADVARLREVIFGEFTEPPKAIMAYLDDFNRRLKRLEKDSKASRSGK